MGCKSPVKLSFMEASELRIGNHILLKDKIVQLCGVTDNGFYIYEDRKSVFNLIEKAKPIELTEEILLKCGFYYDTDYLTFCISSCTLQLDDYANEGYMCVVFGEELYLIKHIHQLQNLYFALTGEELNVQL